MNRPATLLLVDDEALNRDALSRRLTRSGFSVIVAENGQEALDLIAARHVDLVLLDVMMPGLSGTETLRRLRATRSIAELPVIMVTAKDASEDVVEALELGANDYVTKPIDFAVALARIRTQLSARRSDPLTALPNRLLFMERLEQSVAQSHKSGTYDFAVLFLDVDRFKVVNDSLGHAAGDELLVELASRLASSLRSTDLVSRFRGECTLARMGGDEFTILLDGTRSAADAQAVAERLLSVVAKPFQLQGRDVVVSVSIGVVMGDERYQHAPDLIRDADTAMYRAKERGKARCAVFDVSMREAAEERLLLETELRHAIDQHELEVHYQPILEMSGRVLRGFEALVRWRHPARGLVSPDRFIPIAEETGLIVPLGLWVLREACEQMRRWERAFPQHAALTINVNLSTRQCFHPDLVRDVASVLAETGLEPQRLKLEITESLVFEDSEAAVAILTALRALGLQLGLDDFGMGYSALSYLQRLPVQTLKIDRSFVEGIEQSRNVEIIRAIVSLAAGLSMDVTAEGVETAEQAAQLQELSCDTVQGFYFCQPVPSEGAGQIIQDHLDRIAAGEGAARVSKGPSAEDRRALPGAA